jgi:hypothetical protein
MDMYRENDFFSMFHSSYEYEILWTCTKLTYKQEFKEAHSIYFQKMVFLASKTLLSPSGIVKKLFHQL